MAERYVIKRFSFSDLANIESGLGDYILPRITALANRVSHRRVKADEDSLRDEVDYKQFLQIPFTRDNNFGQLFLAYHVEDEPLKDDSDPDPIAFLMALENHTFIKKREAATRGIADIGPNTSEWGPKTSFPFDHCALWFRHDVDYLRDLNTLGTFAYCFQLAVHPMYQGKEVANKLLNQFERYYCLPEKPEKLNLNAPPRTLLLAASVHENQFRAIKLLIKRNGQELLKRHEELLPDVDLTALFLDHYFAPGNDGGHWFRLIQIPDTKSFSREVNYQNIRKAFNTIVPIQLNQSVHQINKVLHHLGAQVTWSSFFHGNHLLEDKYGFSMESHGFFLSLLKTQNRRQYRHSLGLLREIMKYLKEKAKKKSGVASITKTYLDNKKRSTEIFYFNGGDHAMPSFVDPRKFYLDRPQESKDDLFDFVKEWNLVPRGLNSKASMQWWQAFMAYSSRPSEERKKEVEYWKEELELSEEEYLMLRRVATIDVRKNKSRNSKATPSEKEVLQEGKKLLGDINRQRTRRSYRLLWEKYFNLHKKLYEVDKAGQSDFTNTHWWCHAIVPITHSRRNSTMGIMFSFICKKDKLGEDDPHTKMNLIAQTVSSALTPYLLNNLIKLQENDAKELNTRYSFAAVTTRNMAHHVGSHILAHTDNELAIRYLREEIYPDNFDEEIGKFHEYLRTKTHLLADMISSNPVSSVNRWLKREIIAHFNEQEILKRYVSGTNITDVSLDFIDKYGTQSEDILIQVPNGDLGGHAFYMIVTNMIRNVAKYEPTASLDMLQITARVVPTPDDLRRAGKKIDKHTLVGPATPRGYQILLHDNVPRKFKKLKELVTTLNENLDYGQRNLGNNIRSSGWGLMEMSVAAAYLRKKGLIRAEIYRNGTKEILLTEEEKKKKPKEAPDTRTVGLYVLAYRIYLKKPRSILMITRQEERLLRKPEWATERGLRIMTENETLDNEREIYSHDFVLAFDEKTRNRIEKKVKRFPLRWLKFLAEGDISRFQGFFYSDDGPAFISRIWRIWLAGYAERKQMSADKFKLLVFLSDHQPVLPVEVRNTPENLLIYDLHGELAKSLTTQQLRRFGFYQSFGSLCPTGRLLNNRTKSSEAEEQILQSQLIEAAITSILILDERIQRQSLERGHGSNRHIQALANMGIHLPDPTLNEVDLNAVNDGKQAAEWLLLMLNKTKVDFVVLHLGLLESWLGSDISRINAWIKQSIDDIDYRPQIIIISGRGRHTSFPKHFCYQPASSISEYVVSGPPSKYHLVQTLFSSRTRLTI